MAAIATDGSDSLELLEQKLVNCVERGVVLDLAGDQSVDEAAMRSWDDSRTIRASVVRDIVRGRLASNPDPRGLRLRGARIAGRLDLENVTSIVAIELDDCLLEEGLVARDANLPALVLSGCWLEHPDELPLDAERLIATKIVLDRAVVRGHSGFGTVDVSGAHFAYLDCEGASLRNDSGPALDADGLRVDGDVFLRRSFEAIGAGEDGAIRLVGAHLGSLDCEGASLRNDSGPALDADGLRVDGDMLLHHGFRAIGAGAAGTIRLLGAHLGDLNCDGASLRNDSGPALAGEHLLVDRDVLLTCGFEGHGAGESGAIQLHGAHLGGNLDCEGASLRNDSGPAFAADRLQVEQNVYFNEGFQAIGAGESSAIRLLGAHIRGQLNCTRAVMRNDSGPTFSADSIRVGRDLTFEAVDFVGTGELGTIRLMGADVDGNLECDGASLRNDFGPAILAERLQVDGYVFLRRGFKAIGAGEDGAIRFLGANFGGRLELNSASMHNESGPALNAERMRVHHGVFLSNGCEAVGAGRMAAVCLTAAHLGHLDCTGARMRNESGPALNAEALQVDGEVFLAGGFEAVGASDSVVINLTDVRAGGALVFNPARLESCSHLQALLSMDGFVYTGLPTGIDTGEWLRLWRDGTLFYAAQPYQQLAHAHRAVGQDNEVRRILMAQRRDQINRRALTGQAERAWARFTGLTLGYGYQPWRALLGLLTVITCAVLLAIILGSHGALAKVQNPPPPTIILDNDGNLLEVRNPPPTIQLSCTMVDRVGVGLDLGTPLITTGTSARCGATNTTTGQVLTIAGWILRLLAWAFATLFIAGFTGAVRKT